MFLFWVEVQLKSCPHCLQLLIMLPILCRKENAWKVFKILNAFISLTHFYANDFIMFCFFLNKSKKCLFLISIYEFCKVFKLAKLIKINDSVTNSLRKRKRYKSIKKVFELAAKLFYIICTQKLIHFISTFQLLVIWLFKYKLFSN